MRFLLIPLTIILTSCTASNAPNIDWQWEPLETGCQSKALSWLSLSEHSEMSLASIRFGKQPDTGQGPVFLATLDSGVELMGKNREPFLIAAYGDYHKSCVIKMPLSECKEANEVLEDFSKAQIPITYAFEDPVGIVVLHGNTYYLSFKDGQNNFNTWSFYGYDHPMIELIEKSTKKIEHCTIKALNMYKGL